MGQVERVDPPHSGFYGKRLRVGELVVRAHVTVDDRALHEAARRLERLVGQCAQIRANLEAAGVELHLVGRDQVPSDLPMYRHLAGVPFDGALTIDQRGRGYGGLHPCCDEDSLLDLPSRRHADSRDICSHELAHAVDSFGLDPALRSAVRDRWAAAVAEGRWVGAYAATNAQEFFAELTMWYVGSRGDHGTLAAPPVAGPEGLQRYDPASFRLLDDLYRGRRVPAPSTWDRLTPTAATRSTEGREPTEVVVENRTAGPVELWWLDYRGEAVAYGVVPPGVVRSVSTWVTHAWRVVAGGAEVGRYVAGISPGRIVVQDGATSAIT